MDDSRRDGGRYVPKEFNACVKNGGRVRTKTLSNGRYIHICFLNGKSYAGEVKTKQAGLAKHALKKGR